jgi:hypothetical protein
MKNFEIVALVLIEDHLEKIVSGDIKMNVSNQFDESVCESAIEVLNSGDRVVLDKLIEMYKDAGTEYLTAMSLAHNISAFEAPEISSAWTD